MKVCSKIRQFVEEFDLFACNIALRYKGQNDYKSLTGAILSVSLLVFFGIIFVNNFVDMVNRKQISSIVTLTQQQDPSIYSTSTPQFMFGIAITGIDFNAGDRYFNVVVQQYVSLNGSKSKSTINMAQCQPEMWRQLGEQTDSIFQRLKMNQMLCPMPNQTLQFQGRHSSEIFKYFKITMKTCTGVENGQGCRNSSEITQFLNIYELFGFSFYYINSLINADSLKPVSYFLDDTNYFTFTLTQGIASNFFLQFYDIETDYSLLPVEDIKNQHGALGSTSNGIFSLFTPTKGQYIRFYARKSATVRTVSRKFLKIDQLLSYIGGLFGLLFMFVEIPLTYYNTCCYELALASELFTYKKQQNKQSSLQTVEKKEQENDEDRHSVDKFNFLTYLIYLPFFGLKNLGWKSLENSYLSPFYHGIKQVRKQIDLGKIISRFLYLDRVTKAVLDQDQRMILHLFQRENIYQIKEHKTGVKMRKKLIQCKKNQVVSGQLPLHVVQTDEQPPQLEQVKAAYERLKKRNDHLSRYILSNIDQQIIDWINQRSDILSPVKTTTKQKLIRHNTSGTEVELQPIQKINNSELLPFVAFRNDNTVSNNGETNGLSEKKENQTQEIPLNIEPIQLPDFAL